MSNRVKIGWAERDITPNQKIRIAGQFYERVSDIVETPITVTALAIESENDGEQAVICSCDIACISEGLIELVRSELSNVEGLDISKQLHYPPQNHAQGQQEYHEFLQNG